jgi:hypothetical protein
MTTFHDARTRFGNAIKVGTGHPHATKIAIVRAMVRIGR